MPKKLRASEKIVPQTRSEIALESSTFRCLQCGECCSRFTIPIEADKAEYLLTRDWVRERLEKTSTKLEKIDQRYFLIPLTSENICAFLASDKRCMIETLEGREYKPTECKRYPFATLALPDGSMVHDVSANCKSIAEVMMLAGETGRYPTIVPGRDEPDLHRDDVFPEHVQLRPGKKILWREAMAYYERLGEIFESTADPWLALRRIRALLDTSPGALAVSLKTASETCFSALLPGPAPLEWPLTLFFLRKPYGSASWTALLFEKIYLEPRIFGNIPLSVPAVNRVGWDASALDPSVNAYLHLFLRRKLPIAFGHSFLGLLNAACAGYLLVRWHAKALAYLQERDTPVLADVTAAIRLVERYYTGHHPVFLEFFRNPVLAEPLSWLMLHFQKHSVSFPNK